MIKFNAIKYRLGVILLAAGLAGFPAAATFAQEQDSGFLRDYSNLQETKDGQGVTIRAWASPKFAPKNYNAIMIDPLIFYPEPRPTERVSAGALKDIIAYSNDVLKRELDKRFKVVNSPGPGVAKIRAAFTTVGAKGEGLKPYQLIPIAFLVTQAKKAASGEKQKAFLVLEVEVTDSETGELLGSRVRVGTGEKVQLPELGEKDPITLKAVKPMLDGLAGNAFPELSKYVKPQ